jgi:hypothetical protein
LYTIRWTGSQPTEEGGVPPPTPGVSWGNAQSGKSQIIAGSTPLNLR